MATQAQIDANRRNAQKSTGPKTPAGKKTVSQNAVRHGLLSTNALVTGEDAEAYDLFARQILEELQPEGTLERMLVKRVIQTQWRLERLAQVEAALYMKQQGILRHNTDGSFSTVSMDAEPAEWAQELDALNPGASVLGEGFSRANNCFVTLQRYEAHLYRLLERSLSAFERLQYARGSDSLPYAVSRMRQIKIENAVSPWRLKPAVSPLSASQLTDNGVSIKRPTEAELPSSAQREDADDATRGAREQSRPDAPAQRVLRLDISDLAALVQDEAFRRELEGIGRQQIPAVAARAEAGAGSGSFSERSSDTLSRSSSSSFSSSSSSQRPKKTTNRVRHTPRKKGGDGAKPRRKE